MEGLVGLQSLLTNKKGTSPFNFQSNKPLSKVPKTKMVIWRFLSDTFRKNMRCGEISTLRSLSILKRMLELLITNKMSSPSEVYTINFLYIYIPYMPPGHNLQPLPWGLGGGGGCHPQRYNFWAFQLCWTKWLYKFFYRIWENEKTPNIGVLGKWWA